MSQGNPSEKPPVAPPFEHLTSFSTAGKWKTHVWFPILLGTLTAIGPISTDIYLPALPEMERSLHVAAGQGAYTMSSWVAGLVIGQLLAGSVVDRFGRKRPLIYGSLAYAAASVGCALAVGMGSFCLFRFLAAFCASASLVAPKACIRDLTEGKATAVLLSRLVMVQGVVPVLAPFFGALLLQSLSWRGIFWAMGGYGVFCALIVWIFLPETLNPAYRVSSIRLMHVLRVYRAIWDAPPFRWYGLVWMLQGVMVFGYLSAAPPLFEDVFGLNPMAYGILFGVFAVGMIGAAQLNVVLLNWFSERFLMLCGVLSGLGFSLALLVVALTSAPCLSHVCLGTAQRHVWFLPVAALSWLVMAAGGFVSPNAFACALRDEARHAGAAASLGGAGVYFFGLFGSLFAGLLPVGDATSMALIFVTGMLAVCFCAIKCPSNAA